MWTGRLTAPLREFGLGPGVLYLIDRVLRRISPRLGLQVFEFMVQPIVDKPLLPKNLVKSLRFREILAGDPEVAQMPAREDIKASRYRQGARCLGTFRNDTLIGYLWICRPRYDEDEARLTYRLASEQSVFDFDLYVLPQHRLGLGFAAVWHFANEYLRDQNIRYTFSRLTRFNTASRRSHAHLGWKRVGQALVVQAWAVELMLLTLPPFVFLSWTPARRAALVLRPDVLEHR